MQKTCVPVITSLFEANGNCQARWWLFFLLFLFFFADTSIYEAYYITFIPIMMSISRVLRSSSLVSRGCRPLAAKFSEGPVASTTMDQMKSDKRYTPVSEIPSSLIDETLSNVVHSPGFSIKGQAKEGRPAYLDFQATTPTDPRVVDAMVRHLSILIGLCNNSCFQNNLMMMIMMALIFFVISCLSCWESTVILIQGHIHTGMT